MSFLHEIRAKGEMDGQTEEESLICSLFCHGEAVSRHIKASFRSPPSISFFSCSFWLSNSVDKSGNIEYAKAKHLQRHSYV